jgi:predicted unusual protein kinase regulating ubiquinone biosynthesis (AarF/ABC1/UbiB family)
MKKMLNAFKRLQKLFHIGWAAKKIRASQSETEKLLAQRALVALLADARGISLKVGQLFAAVEGGSEFQSLTDSVPALPLKIMLPVLEKSLGVAPKTIFKNIQPATAAASLGQVHLAEFHDGTPVAIKIRYPDIANAVNAELKIADLMPSVGKVQEWGFDLNAYKQTLFDTLQRELDYRIEAKTQTYFRENVRVPRLEIPRVYDEFSSDCVLVQSRATGMTFPEIVHWSEFERRLIAETLLQTLFTSLFVAGEIHADPHNGNTFYNHADHDSMMTLLDFGCTVSLNEMRRLALLKLILGCREKSAVNPLACFVALGFDAQKLAHIQGALPLLSQMLFRPFLLNHAFNLAEWQLEKNITDLLGDKRWWFRSAGAADVLLLMRAFQGLTQQLQQLRINLNWWKILEQSVGKNLLQQARDLNLPAVNVSATEFKALDFASQAQKLHVKITKNNQPLVSVELPAEAALDLEKLVPEEVRLELAQSGAVDLAKVLQRLKEEGLSPQVLFACELGEKQYRVWLA